MEQQGQSEEDNEKGEAVNMEYTTTCTTGSERRSEPAKDILTTTGAILREIADQVRMIGDAVYRGGETNRPMPQEKLDGEPPMLVILDAQRGMAKDILEEVAKIREALW